MSHFRLNSLNLKIEYNLNGFVKLFWVKMRVFLLFSSSKFKLGTQNLKYMTIGADFDIINYTKNSESSMKIDSLPSIDANQKIR